MIFSLLHDFASALASMPQAHTRRRVLALLDEAIRRDVHFVARHPTTLFQCLWNSSWWYDCPEAAAHYEPAPETDAERPLSQLLASWRDGRGETGAWLRSLRPPAVRLGSALRLVLRAHVGGVNCVSYSPDGRHLLSTGESILVSDADTGAAVLRVPFGQTGVSAAAYSPDGTRIVSRSHDDTLRVWDARTGAELVRILERGWGAHFSTDGRHIVGGAEASTLGVWDAGTGIEVRRFDEMNVHEVTASPDGRHVVIAGIMNYDGSRLIDLDDGRVRFHLAGSYAAFAPDGRRVVTADSSSSDFWVSVWDTDSGAEVLRIVAPQMVFDVAFSPDGRWIGGGMPDFAMVWDAATGAELRRFAGHAREVGNVCFSLDGRHFATGSADGTVRVWDVERMAPTAQLVRHDDEIRDVRFAPDGHRVLTISKDYTLRLWNVESGLQVLRLQTEFVDTAGFTPDGQRIFAASTEIAKAVYQWDARTGELVQTIHGKGGAKAVAPRGRSDGPWVLRGRPGRNKWLGDFYRGTAELDSVVESAVTGEAVAWYPEPLEHVAAGPSGRVWAGHIGQDVCLLALEGAPEGI